MINDDLPAMTSYENILGISSFAIFIAIKAVVNNYIYAISQPVGLNSIISNYSLVFSRRAYGLRGEEIN